MTQTDRTLGARVRTEARRLGFDLVGIAELRASDHAAFYRRWLEDGRHGEMAYLARPDAVERRLSPRSAWPELRSAIVVGHNYFPGDGDGASNGNGRGEGGGSGRGEGDRSGKGASNGHRLGEGDTDGNGRGNGAGNGAGEGADAGAGIIARYARGRDYHRVVKQKLLALLRWIEADIGRELPAARAYVDTGPVLERELARRAGLGWFGRNTMLIHPRHGSYFFLGTLLVELELEPDSPFEEDRCGTCSACVDACPTGALLGRDADGAPVIDATRCISYLTIENRGPIPRELRPLIGNRVYGCDICQEVCPWNGSKLAQATREPDYRPRVPGLSGEVDPLGSHSRVGTGARPHPHTHTGPSTESPSLVELMRMTREQWDRWTRGSAIRRAGYAGFRRNIAVAMGNWLAFVDEPPKEAVAVLRDALDDHEPLVREHAAWALSRVV